MYRLFLNTLTFSSTGELVTGLLVLVPFLVQFEREMGTKKFASFLLVKCAIISTTLQLLCLVFLNSSSRSASASASASANANASAANTNNSTNYFAPGPYPLIGSLLYLYHCYTPRLHTKFIGILGFDFSEKFMTYVFTFLTVYSQGILSILPTACGILASWISISQKNFYGRWECKLPNFVVYGVGANVGRIFGLDSLITSTVFMSRGSSMGLAGGVGGAGVGAGAGLNRRGGGGSGRGIGAGINAGAGPPIPRQQQQQQQQQQPQLFQPMPAPQPPSPEAIEQLTAMGFERDAVVRALGAADNNVEAAANRLLSGI